MDGVPVQNQVIRARERVAWESERKKGEKRGQNSDGY
jgi:hypothetical protein